MASETTNSSGPASGRVPRGIPKTKTREAVVNARLLVGGDGSPDPFAGLSALSPLPVPAEPSAQCAAFLGRIVRSGGHYNIVPCEGTRPLFPGVLVEGELLLKKKCAAEVPGLAPGGFIRPNPVGGEGSGKSGCHCDRDITGFEYLLAESDLLPLPLQAAVLARLIGMGLPLVSAVHSGGKSIHALVRVNARGPEDFRSASRRTYARLARLGFDPSTGNPSRLTRLPGCVRTLPDGSTSLQRLLYLA